MAKLYFDEKQVQNNVITNVDYAINKLNSADATMNNIYIPYGFYYTNTLRQCLNDIRTLNSELKYTQNWLKQSKNEYITAMNEIEDNLNNLSTFELEERKERV